MGAAHFPRNAYKREQMTGAANNIAAVMKASTAPLHTLSDDMLESITRSHAKRPQQPALLERLRKIVADRKRREGHGG